MEKIQIFISSTFKDMDAERDMVNHFVKQRIEKELARYSIFKSIEIVDLRWGVNTQDLPEDERENKVLRQCVDNIRSSRPYFIAFIGDRYGWIPPKNRWQKVMDELSDDELEMLGDEINEVKSVTELEILFGALKNRKSLPNSFFLFRNTDAYASMDFTDRSKFCDSDPVLRSKLGLLKKKIYKAFQSTGYEKNIMQYDCEWDGQRMHVDETAMKKVADTIVHSILFTERQEHSMETELDQLASLEMKKVDELIPRFAGRQDYLQGLLYHIDHDGEPILIVAPEGYGKTSIASALYAVLSQYGDEYVPFIHLTEYTGPMAFAEIMLKKWLWKTEGVPEGKRHMNMEANLTCLLGNFIQSFHLFEGKKIVLIMDNVQYLKGLDEILSYPEIFEHVCLVMTSDREINLKNFCAKGKLFGLPLLNQEESLELIDKYTNYYNKSLPSKVMEAIAAKTDINGNSAMTNPLWSILLLHHLINIDVEDYEEMRNGDACDEGDKITRFFMDRVRTIPAEVQRLVYWLDYQFAPEGQYNAAHEVILAAEEGMDIHQLQKKLSEKSAYGELTLRSVLKEFSPLLYVDVFTDKLLMNYPYLFAKQVEPITLSQVPFEQSFAQILDMGNRLMQASLILKEHHEDEAASLCFHEAQLAISCFKFEEVEELIGGDEKLVPHLSGLSLDRNQNFPETFVKLLDAYRAEPSWDNKMCLEVGYYLWCSQVEYLKHHMDMHGADKNRMDVLESMVNMLSSATVRICGLTSRNLVSYEGEALYLSAKEYLARMLYKNDELSQTCLAKIERIYRSMWNACPFSHSITRRLAIALDDTTMFCPSLMEFRNQKAIQLFDLLYKDKECAIEDLFMALERGMVVSRMQHKYDEVIQKSDYIIEKYLQGVDDDPKLVRFYAIALDYKAEAYALKHDIGRALETIKSAYSYFARDYENEPDDAQRLHSLVINLEKQVRYGFYSGMIPQMEILLYLKFCHVAIDKNPGDAFAYKQLAVGEVMALYVSALRDDCDYIERHSRQTFDLVKEVIFSCRDWRIANAEIMRATISMLSDNGHADLANSMDLMYQSLATEVLGKRLAPSAYFYPQGI